MASVELRRVSKVFSGTTTVLDAVDLHVEDGELLVLLGPNGSGKTTLLRLIAGLERVTSGEIWLGGQAVTHWPARHRDVGMVFQSGVLYPHLTVEQNLKFGWKRGAGGGGIGGLWSRLIGRARTNQVAPRGGSRSDDQDPQGLEARVLEDRVRATVQRLGIESVLHRYPRQLSGGERQRVALGRVLVRQPAVFLLDEPLANADTRLRQELRSVFHRAREWFPGTMILVSHDHSDALALGQRIAVLGRGKVQQVGRAGELYATPRNRFVAEFLGRSSMRFVEGSWEHVEGRDWLTTRLGRWSVPAAIAAGPRSTGTRVTLGLRPEALRLAAAERPGSAASLTGVVEWVEWLEEGAAVHVAVEATTRTGTEWSEKRATGEDGTEAGAKRERQRSNNDAQHLVVRLMRSDFPRVGERVHLAIEWDQAVWFDPHTENNWAIPG